MFPDRRAPFRCLFTAIVTVGLVAMPSRAWAISDTFPVAQECEWPTAVGLKPWFNYNGEQLKVGKCSGVLVAATSQEAVILTAAHCLGTANEPVLFDVHFGEDASNAELELIDAECYRFPPPGNGGLVGSKYYGNDFAYCVVYPNGAALSSMARTPVMVPDGCSEVYLSHEIYKSAYSSPTVMLASLGSSEGEQPWRYKRAADVHISGEIYDSQYFGWELMLQSTPEYDYRVVFEGDSGGPALFQMFDGTWRVIGNASTWAFTSGGYASAPRWVKWVEDQGPAITPCHDWFSQVGWVGTPLDCDQLATNPGSTADKSWAGNMCQTNSVVFDADPCGGWEPDPDNGPWLSADGAWLREKATLESGIIGIGSPGELAYPVMFKQQAGSLWMTQQEDVVYGSAFDDMIDGRRGADWIEPGSGADVVDAGAQDDVVVVRASCELENGEILDGGRGYDTLYLPVSQRTAELQYGVTILGFEEVLQDVSQVSRADCQDYDIIGGYFDPPT